MSDDKKWYVLRVISGKEKKIKEYLEIDLKRLQYDSIVTTILVPTEKVYKISKGKKVIKEKNLFPGYIYIEAVNGKFTGEVISSIVSTTNVINFLHHRICLLLRCRNTPKLYWSQRTGSS